MQCLDGFPVSAPLLAFLLHPSADKNLSALLLFIQETMVLCAQRVSVKQAGAGTLRWAVNQWERLSRQTLSSTGKSDRVPSSFLWVSSSLKGALHCGHQAGSVCTAHARMHLPAQQGGTATSAQAESRLDSH